MNDLMLRSQRGRGVWVAREWMGERGWGTDGGNPICLFLYVNQQFHLQVAEYLAEKLTRNVEAEGDQFLILLRHPSHCCAILKVCHCPEINYKMYSPVDDAATPLYISKLSYNIVHTTCLNTEYNSDICFNENSIYF